MKNRIVFIAFATLLLLSACSENIKTFDASGAFEAEETIISSEALGTIKQFDVEEGQLLKAGQFLGYVDSIQLYLKKKQLLAQLNSLSARVPNIASQTNFFDQQIAVIQIKLKNLKVEQKRFQNLVNADAATQKQLDDINALLEENQQQLLVIEKQKNAQISMLQTQSMGLNSDLTPVLIQIEQINDQLQKCLIVNPKQGTVLTKYAEVNEMTAMGKPLYKIADLSNMVLRAYIDGKQLPLVKLNQKVIVQTDDGKGGFKKAEGVITWINNKAEFTPKTIQTKDERANLVYAIKVKLKNDGTYKIGMYGELIFNTSPSKSDGKSK